MSIRILASEIIVPFLIIISSVNLLFSQGFNAVSIPSENIVITAGDSGKIYWSFNSGIDWYNADYNNINFNSISSSVNYAYLTASDSKVYKVSSGSVSPVTEYTVTGNNMFNSVHFSGDSTGYICGNNGVIYKTTNGGLNWVIKNKGIPIVDLNSISFKDDFNGVTAGDGGLVFITSNGGNEWISAATETITTNNIIKVKYFNDGITAAGEYGILLIKNNNSNKWKLVKTKTSSDIRGISGSGINDVHVCGGGGFIRNNKNGNNGFNNFEPNPMMAALTDIFISGSKTGFAVSSLNRAVLKTTNNGENWEFTQGVSASYIWVNKATSFSNFGNTLCRHPYNRETFFCGMGNRVIVSRDNGESWTDIAGVPGQSMHSFYVSPVDTNIWVCAISGTPRRVMRSTNYGQNWTTVIAVNFGGFGQPLEMDQNNPSVYYYAPAGGGFYRSSDNGLTFQLLSNNSFQSPCDILVMWDSSEVIFVGDGPKDGSGGKIYRSSDSGYSWNIVFSDSNAIEIPSMSNSVFEKNIVYSTETGATFWRSTDYGNSFHSLYETGFYNWGSAVCEEDPTLIMDGLYNNTCYFSLNKGADWNSASGNVPFAGLGLLAPARDNLFYYTTNGIYKMKVIYHGIVAVNENYLQVNLPDKYVLYQNYPNPFNPNTVIRYSLKGNHFITLKVFDALGKEVAALVNEKQNAGTYEFDFDGSGLASGIFFYKLEADGFTETKSMVLLK